jgi:hypothetical protein
MEVYSAVLIPQVRDEAGSPKWNDETKLAMDPLGRLENT